MADTRIVQSKNIHVPSRDNHYEVKFCCFKSDQYTKSEAGKKISRKVPEVFHGQLQNPELPNLILSRPVFERYIMLMENFLLLRVNLYKNIMRKKYHLNF